MVDRLYKEVASVVAEQLLAPDRYYDSRRNEERRLDNERRARHPQSEYSPGWTRSSSSRGRSQSSHGRSSGYSHVSSGDSSSDYHRPHDREFSPRGWHRQPSPPRGRRFEPYDRRPAIPRQDDHRGRDQRFRHQGRAQEDRLRRVAQQSRGQRPANNPSRAPRTIVPPDSAEAELDADNLPQFPPAVAASESTDPFLFGLAADWIAREEERRSLAIGREQSDEQAYERVVPELSPDVHGDWAEAVSVRTLDQARDLMRWAGYGQPHAMAFIRDAIITRLSADPTLLRTPGEIILLAHQNAIWNRFRLAAPGAVVPRAKLVHRLPKPRGSSPGPTWEIGGPAPRPEGSSLEPQDIPFLATSAATAGGLISLTESSPGGAKSIVSENGHALSTTDLEGWYSSIPTVQWPRGLRMHNGELPRPEVISAAPHQGDVRAWVTLNALAPVRERPSHHRSRFLDTAVRLFSIRGLFGGYVEGGGYVAAALPLEHYPFHASNITLAQVSAWMVQHGVEPSSAATTALEDFCRSRRLVREYGAGVDASTTTFTSFPFGPTATARLKIYPEEHWSALRHGALRNSRPTTYPQHPGAQDVIMAEPIEDVDGT